MTTAQLLIRCMLLLQVAAALKNMVKAASEMRTLHNITVGQKAAA